MKLSPAQRLALWGMFDGHCAYCGCSLPEKGWQADHVEPIMRDGSWVRVIEPHRTHKFVQNKPCLRPENERVDNFFPSCRACNINKSCMSIDVWRGVLEKLVHVCRRDHAAFRHAERFGLIAQNKTKIVFYFETYLNGGSK